MAREGEPAEPQFAYRADNRRVAFEVSGDPDGFPIFLMHGTPGSREGPKPRGIVLHRLGIKLISYDRPGYGDSDRFEGRHVADAARDVEMIADKLGLERFSVAGRSGGGPHALACAAAERLRHRVAGVAVLVGLAPSDAGELDWFAGMNADNVRGFGGIDPDTASVVEEIRRRAERTIEDPRFLLEDLMLQMTAADRRVVNTPALRQLITNNYERALKAGPYGWIDDVLALRRSWKLDLRTIDTRVTKIRLWHGADDTFAPVSHTRWLATQIPGAEIQVRPGAAHFDAMEELPRILHWLASDAYVPPVRALI